jgi:hypothetical protein
MLIRVFHIWKWNFIDVMKHNIQPWIELKCIALQHSILLKKNFYWKTHFFTMVSSFRLLLMAPLIHGKPINTSTYGHICYGINNEMGSPLWKNVFFNKNFFLVILNAVMLYISTHKTFHLYGLCSLLCHTLPVPLITMTGFNEHDYGIKHICRWSLTNKWFTVFRPTNF